MTPTPTHTLESLEAMPARELDAVVAEVVFGLDPWVPKRDPHTGAEHHEDKVLGSGIPYYSTTWDGFGAIFLRLRELNLGLSMGGHPAEMPNVQAYNNNYQVYIPQRSLGVSAPELPRAAAIAAVILVQAVQGAGE
ncbi:hypothetical protein TA3x_000403 [Tundrisphaera sp. TA3]|uniref:hypothetical protein n=1 Tax=Tundrisphaera sp. TA3 TaxID=3435775 RepID=UPI003EB717A6